MKKTTYTAPTLQVICYPSVSLLLEDSNLVNQLSDDSTDEFLLDTDGLDAEELLR